MDSAIFERPVNTIAEMVFEDVNSQSDFDELKDEFCIMYQEMQDMVRFLFYFVCSLKT